MKGTDLAPEGTVFVCCACGKRARSKYGFDAAGQSTDSFNSGVGRVNQGSHDRSELGGVLRLELCRRTQCPIVEVSPKTLKKFVTGAGTGSKDFMVSTLAKNHARTFTSDNEADAFALCQLGLALTGQVEVTTKADREYLGKLKKGWAIP